MPRPGTRWRPTAGCAPNSRPRARACAWRLLAAPFGDFGPRLAPGSGRTRVTTVHQGLTLSTRRDLPHERALFDKLLEALDFLEDDVHEW